VAIEGKNITEAVYELNFEETVIHEPEKNIYIHIVNTETEFEGKELSKLTINYSPEKDVDTTAYVKLAKVIECDYSDPSCKHFETIWSKKVKLYCKANNICTIELHPYIEIPEKVVGILEGDNVITNYFDIERYLEEKEVEIDDVYANQVLDRINWIQVVYYTNSPGNYKIKILQDGKLLYSTEKYLEGGYRKLDLYVDIKANTKPYTLKIENEKVSTSYNFTLSNYYNKAVSVPEPEIFVTSGKIKDLTINLSCYDSVNIPIKTTLKYYDANNNLIDTRQEEFHLECNKYEVVGFSYKLDWPYKGGYISYTIEYPNNDTTSGFIYPDLPTNQIGDMKVYGYISNNKLYKVKILYSNIFVDKFETESKIQFLDCKTGKKVIYETYKKFECDGRKVCEVEINPNINVPGKEFCYSIEISGLKYGDVLDEFNVFHTESYQKPYQVSVIDILAINTVKCDEESKELKLRIAIANAGNEKTPDLTGLLKIITNSQTIYTKTLYSELDNIAPENIRYFDVEIKGSDFEILKQALNVSNLCGTPIPITIEISGKGIQPVYEMFYIST